MNTTFLPIAISTLLLLLPSLTSATYTVELFQNRDCSGTAAETLELEDDNACTEITLAGIESVRYQSDDDCTLGTFDSESCTSQEATSVAQDLCFSPGYIVTGVKCSPS